MSPLLEQVTAFTYALKGMPFALNAAEISTFV